MKLQGIRRDGQNSTDKGELCEMFIKEVLYDLFSDNFKIYRGGKIVNINNSESDQLDVLLLSKNSIKLFGDKGIYPVESAYGVFSVTATLDHPKLFEGCIKEFKSIPKQNPMIQFLNFIEIPDLEQKMLRYWYERFPFKCVFGFKGDINANWETELNLLAKENPDAKSYLPDIIIVNKKGMIRKLYGKEKALKADGTELTISDKDFHYTDFKKYNNYGAAINILAKELYDLSHWQYNFAVQYQSYFKKDLIDDINSF
ncbi:MAG TPA: hypothetical protein PLM24_01030 [Methanothrix sp.]|nr:hypothetical protein [Methanothrix sp.]HPJ83990.1 hypothetical protein [Methanothrix sp.]HPR65700.1 hypothetical protein [Methanothrix sp.]